MKERIKYVKRRIKRMNKRKHEFGQDLKRRRDNNEYGAQIYWRYFK